MSPAAAPIRPARREDAPFLAWAMLAASRSHLPRGSWDLLLDGPEEELLGILARLAVGEPPTMCHWSGFRVALVDGQPAAAMAGYDTAGLAGLEPLLDAALGARGWTAARIAAAAARFAPFETCSIEQPTGVWIVEWVATDPARRRRGLARDLLVCILDEGRRRGHTRAQVGMLLGNDAALRAYLGAGFRVEAERRDEAFAAALGCPGTARLARAL